MTEHYRFDDEQRSLSIRDWDLPAPWLNYLSNGRLHAFVSQAGGGLLWHQSPLVGRLTRYRFSQQPIDGPGFYLYVREKDGTVWSPSGRPVEAPLDEFEAIHEPGCTTYRGSLRGLTVELRLFVAPSSDTLVWDVQLSGDRRDVDLFAYSELSLLEWREESVWGCYIKHMLKTWWDEESASVRYLYHHHAHPRLDQVPLVYFGCSREVASHSGHRDDFIGGYGGERNPRGVRRGHAGDKTIDSGDPCVALHHAVRFAPDSGEPYRVQFFLGAEAGAIERFDEVNRAATAHLSRLSNAGEVDAERERLADWWAGHFRPLQCALPESAQSLERMINTWNPIQCVHTGRYSRSTSYFAPGFRGMGFRDSCQDMLAVATRDPEWARTTFLELLRFQYADGHAIHTAYPFEGQSPPTSIHSDDHLWLPLLAHALVAETGDLSLLDETVDYLDHDRGTVWEHLLRATDFTEENLGAHGLPLTLRSDWNDIIGKFAREGRGESSFAAMQYVHALRLLRELALARDDESAARKLEERVERQLNALSRHGWDGRWWRRGFDDDGAPVGSATSRFGRVWLNPQSWAVIADVGDRDKQVEGMASAREHLSTEVGLRILAPGFATYPEESTPFSGYGPGTGENAAIFCHAHCWAVIASAVLGEGEAAWGHYRQMLPERLVEKLGVESYRAEPYAWASNIVGPENNRHGWANVSQCTGTAAWMEVAATQYLLGLRPGLEGLWIDPVLSSEIREFSVDRVFRGKHLRIEVIDGGRGASSGVSTATLETEGVTRTLDCSRGRGTLLSSEELELVTGQATVRVTVG